MQVGAFIAMGLAACTLAVSDAGSAERVRELAPEFSLSDIDGNRVGSAYRSHTATLVHFWATWCVPCMREIPELNRLAHAYERGGAAIYAVSLDTATAGELRQLARVYNIQHTVLIGDDSVARGFGGVESFPTAFVVDPRGRIVETVTGVSEAGRRRIDASLRTLVAAGRPKAPP